MSSEESDKVRKQPGIQRRTTRPRKARIGQKATKLEESYLVRKRQQGVRLRRPGENFKQR